MGGPGLALTDPHSRDARSQTRQGSALRREPSLSAGSAGATGSTGAAIKRLAESLAPVLRCPASGQKGNKRRWWQAPQVPLSS
ncbi:hypothetical protein LPJ56_006731 [Coemansia sp. RSA 2599]|nr:hypothetical protein LPJ75_006769 [Coemansia sp. RSA 2598]KAJ1804451.1 hypothetical protein LPJ56_006731 [Coemansia sp. RSA 2599]